MGSFFLSVHLKSDDANAVEAAAQLVARRAGTRFFLAPPSGGWFNLYPSADNWHPRQAAGVAKASRSEHAIALQLHDSDVFSYWYFRSGVLRDRFVSAPDYFGRATKGDMEATGDAEAFRDLLTSAVSREKLKRIIRGRIINGEIIGNVPAFEDDRLEQVADLLGIIGVLTSYEYLKAGETVDGIGGQNDLIEID